MSSQNTQGLISILIASFLFGFMAFLVKVLSASLPAAEILFFRSTIGILFILFVIFYGFKAFRVNNRHLLFVRGLFGGMAAFLFFCAISRIPLSSAVLLSNSYPLFATLFSAILIKEKPNFDSILALFMAFCGLFLVLDPRFGKLDIGYLMALASGIFGGVAVTSIRELRKTDSSWVIVFSLLLGSAVFCVPGVAVDFRFPAFSEWGQLFLICAVGIAAQLNFTRPFKYIKASEGSIVALATSAFAITFSILFLDEVLTSQFILGALFVFGSSLYLIAREESWVKI